MKFWNKYPLSVLEPRLEAKLGWRSNKLDLSALAACLGAGMVRNKSPWILETPLITESDIIFSEIIMLSTKLMELRLESVSKVFTNPANFASL